MCDEEFGLLADRAADFVFVGFDAALAVVERLKPKLKVGGHMVVHSSEGQSLEEMMALLGTWKEKINIVRDGQQLWIGKLLKHHAGRIVKQQPSGKPRACIVRYGAIGDMVMVTPLIK
jgi:ADP-heptose:LPS heptosyltransferase